jgi:hypothetical protein
MTAAFKAQLSSTHKFVLVALCDNANDQGECFPSISMLCEKTSLSDRAVQKSIAYLVEKKFIKRDIRNGRSAYYFIADPRTWFTPEQESPPNHVHPTPERGSPPPPNVVHPTPEPRSPITINEPSNEPSGNHQKRAKVAQDDFDPMAALLEAGVDEQTAKDWVQHRKAKKFSFAMTVVKDRKKQAAIAGMSLDDALSMEVSRGWQGFKASWVTKLQGRANQPAGPPTSHPTLGKAGQETAAAAQRLREKLKGQHGY